MRNLPLKATFLATATLCGTLHAQRTIRVPLDATTIQGAIDQSSNGDTVLVSTGMYHENIDFHGKNISVIGPGGANTTILEGDGSGPTVQFVSGETRSATLKGLTIRNGAQAASATSGGGIFVSGSSPTIVNNIVGRNSCNGIASVGAAPLIRDNTITGTLPGNSACAYTGTALLLLNASPLGGVTEIDGNTIENNSTPRLGVVHAESVTDLLFQRNEVRNNTYTLGGSNPVVINVQLARFASIVGNYIHDNFTSGLGGSGLFVGSELNPPYQTFFGLPRIAVVNNTFLKNGNASGASGTQVFVYNTAVRTLVANNIAMGTDAIVCYVTGIPKAPVVLQNNVASTYSSGCTLDLNAHNIIAADAGLSAAGIPQPGSPALDAGNNSALPQPATDIAGNARARSSRIPVTLDAGAFEAPGASAGPQTRLVIAPLRYEVVEGAATDVAVALSSSDTSTLTSTSAVLFLDGAPVQTIPILTNGTATFSHVTVPSGRHLIFATSLANGSTPAAQSTIVTVNGAAASAPNAAIATPASHVVMEVDPVAQIGNSLSTQLRCSLSDGTANGSMRQYDNGLLKAETILTGTTVANATYFSDPGPHIYQCEYQDGRRSSSTVAAQVLTTAGSTAPPALQLFSLPDPSEYGDPVTIGGSITPYTANLSATVRITEGTTVLVDTAVGSNGVASTVRADLAPGVHTFFGTITSTAGNTSGTFTQTVHFAPTRISLAAAPTTGTTLTPIVLTFATTSTYTGSPVTGTVSILDGATKLGIAGIANGTVTLPANTLTGGTHILTAVYSGTTIFASATSNAVTINLTVPPPPDFSITPANPTLSVQTEHHATVALTLTSINGFSGPVHLTCGPLPPVATCTFDKSAYALSSTAAVALVLETSAIPGYKSQLQSPAGTIAICVLPASLLLLLLRRKRLIALAALLTLAGCSSKYPDHTPPGKYTVNITATGTSGTTTVTHTVPLTLTVTPE